MERPEFVTDSHLAYLDDLRESGLVNMFGSSEYIVEQFGIGKIKAREIVKYWMKSFGKGAR